MKLDARLKLLLEGVRLFSSGQNRVYLCRISGKEAGLPAFQAAAGMHRLLVYNNQNSFRKVAEDYSRSEHRNNYRFCQNSAP